MSLQLWRRLVRPTVTPSLPSVQLAIVVATETASRAVCLILLALLFSLLSFSWRWSQPHWPSLSFLRRPDCVTGELRVLSGTLMCCGAWGMAVWRRANWMGKQLVQTIRNIQNIPRDENVLSRASAMDATLYRGCGEICWYYGCGGVHTRVMDVIWASSAAYVHRRHIMGIVRLGGMWRASWAWYGRGGVDTAIMGVLGIVELIRA